MTKQAAGKWKLSQPANYFEYSVLNDYLDLFFSPNWCFGIVDAYSF